MKNKLALTLVALGLALPAVNISAQDGNPPPRGPRDGGPRRGSPIVAAIDANKDGVIDTSELAASAKALAALDKNGDGKLTADEFHGGRGPEGRPRPAGNEDSANTDASPRPPRPAPPLIGALDTNHDGVIDASELANASAALKALDKNGDGQLTREELGGPGGPRGPRPGGPEGKGGKKHPQPAPEQ